jgi:hypothetical protein
VPGIAQLPHQGRVDTLIGEPTHDRYQP